MFLSREFQYKGDASNVRLLVVGDRFVLVGYPHLFVCIPKVKDTTAPNDQRLPTIDGEWRCISSVTMPLGKVCVRGDELFVCSNESVIVMRLDCLTKRTLPAGPKHNGVVYV